jgi:hypothetical protein
MPALTFIEKRIICEIAREAYALWPDREIFERSCPAANAFTAWRHQEQGRVLGVRSLNLCDGSAFDRLKEHFQNLRRVWAAHQRDETAGQQSLCL